VTAAQSGGKPVIGSCGGASIFTNSWGRRVDTVVTQTTVKAPRDTTYLPRGSYVLRSRNLFAAALAVCLAQTALAIPASLIGLFQQDLGPTSAQLGWISDAFLVPIVVLELSSGVVGDLFGRKRLLVGGALLMATGELIAALSPGAFSALPARGPLRATFTGNPELP
jgi:Na+/melibiose symporter-like transporter